MDLAVSSTQLDNCLIHSGMRWQISARFHLGLESVSCINFRKLNIVLNYPTVSDSTMWSPFVMIPVLVVGGLLFSTGRLSLLMPLFVLGSLPSTSAEENSSSFKSMRKICECGSALKESGRNAKITLYTRHGVVLNAIHHEKRCRSCGRGYFYSFHTHGRFLVYDDTCLEQPYLITSRKTGFAIDLLYEWSLSILHHSSR